MNQSSIGIKCALTTRKFLKSFSFVYLASKTFRNYLSRFIQLCLDTEVQGKAQVSWTDSIGESVGT